MTEIFDLNNYRLKQEEIRETLEILDINLKMLTIDIHRSKEKEVVTEFKEFVKQLNNVKKNLLKQLNKGIQMSLKDVDPFISEGLEINRTIGEMFAEATKRIEVNP
jgi:hypothetical protein